MAQKKTDKRKNQMTREKTDAVSQMVQKVLLFQA
jgi:hypothetical protein